MTYEDFVADMAKRTGLNGEDVRKVLFHLPDALLQMPTGDNVRTPLGVFRKMRTKARPIRLPDGEAAEVPNKVAVKLRSGTRLKIQT